MSKRINALEDIRIAAPCPANWERMKGDERARFCAECELSVYNISAMTQREALALIEGREGRICARFYRRADGTILTKDCPVGLRAIRRRAARTAGAALAALISLCSIVVGQTHKHKKKEKQECTSGTVLQLKRATISGEHTIFSGIILDPNGAVISGATVVTIDEHTGQKFTSVSTSDGAFSFPLIVAGTYTLEAEAIGFQPFKSEHLVLNANESLRVNLELGIGEAVTMGIIVFPATNALDINAEGRVYTFSDKEIRDLPH